MENTCPNIPEDMIFDQKDNTVNTLQIFDHTVTQSYTTNVTNSSQKGDYLESYTRFIVYNTIKHYKARAPFRKGVNYFGGNTRTCTLERALYQIKQPLTLVSSEIKYVRGEAEDILFLRNPLVIGFYLLHKMLSNCHRYCRKCSDVVNIKEITPSVECAPNNDLPGDFGYIGIVYVTRNNLS